MTDDESWRSAVHEELRRSKRKPAQPYNTGTWKRQRACLLDEHRYCIGCAAIGIATEATVADHVVPHQGDTSKFEGELQPSCAWHHNSIKPILERQWRAGKLPATGLRLNSPQAIALTRARYRLPVGEDGFAVRPRGMSRIE